MIEIIPSLLVTSRREFETKLRLVESEVKTIHVDILDGSLFDNVSWFDAEAVGAMRTDVQYEIHLMVKNPLPIIESWKKNVKGVRRAIIHAEIERQPGSVIDVISDALHLEAGLALNPESPLEEEHQLIHHINQLTIMGVHPGHSGRAFEGNDIFGKIRQARVHQPNLEIEIDGGVNLNRAPEFVKAGATRLCSGSLIFQSKDPKQMLAELKRVILSVPTH